METHQFQKTSCFSIKRYATRKRWRFDRIEIGLISKTAMETLHHTSHVVNNRMLPLAQTTKR